MLSPNASRVSAVPIKKLILQLLGFVGLSAHDVYLLKSIRHRGWISRAFTPGNKTIPVQRFEFTDIETPDKEDLRLCERLIDAFHFGLREDQPAANVSPMWASIIDNKQRALFETLLKKNPEDLANLLARMFQSEILHGIDSGDLYTGRNWRYHSLKLLDDLSSLAEYLGVVRAESGQGTIGHAFANGLDDLVSKIEAELGSSIGGPRIGGAYGIVANDSLVTLQSPEYVYVASRIAHAIESFFPSISNPENSQLNLLEIGAGYGGTAQFLLRLCGSRAKNYTIVDLPLANVLQGYYLANSVGPSKVRLNGEDGSGLIEILPPAELFGKTDIDILLNQNSLPEIPQDAGASYLTWAKQESKLFFSYNYEALTEQREFAVVTVPELVAQVGGFRRLNRALSWLRPGYVEEIYVTDRYADSNM